MRKLTSVSFLSLDGVIESPWEWVGEFFNVENKEHASAAIDDVDYFLLGRKTYERFSSTWPHVKGDAYLDKMNALRKLVVSDTLTNATWNAKILKPKNAVEQIRQLKTENGKNIIKYGFGALDEMLIENNLIDDLKFCIIPLSVGSGRHAFEGFQKKNYKLTLVDSKIFNNGVVELTYVPRSS